VSYSLCHEEPLPARSPAFLRGMIGGMDDEPVSLFDRFLDRHDGVTLRTVFAVFMILAVLYPLAWAIEPRLQPPMWLNITALTGYGCWFIWRVVRWFNRRDDPRQQKLPPDAP